MQAVEISDEDLLQERLNSQKDSNNYGGFGDAASIGGSAAAAATDLAVEALRARMSSVTIDQQGSSSHNGLFITVDDPEVRDPGLFSPKYVAYAVTVSPKLRSVINVRRRYNDFLWLREVLVKHYPGYFVPPVPPKKAIGNFDSGFLDERQGDLQRFMNRLCQDPILPNNLAFRMFLCRHENSFEKGQQEAEAALEAERQQMGTLAERYQRLFPAALGKQLPEALPEEMLKLREVLDRSEQELLGMFEQGKISEQRRHEDAAARKTLAAHLTALHKTENNYAERPDPARADLMSSFADWATVAEASILPFSAHLINTVKYDLQDVQAFIEIMDMRADLFKDTEKAKLKADKWREMENQSLSDKQQKNKFEDMKNEEDMIAHLRVVDQIVRHFTLPATWAFKVVAFKKSMSHFAQQQLADAKKQVQLWEEATKKLM